MITGVIGTGSMGAMLARAFVHTGALPATDLWLANRSPDKLARLRDELPGVNVGTPIALARRCRRMFFCTRGPDAVLLLKQLGPLLTEEQIVVVLHSPLRLSAVERLAPSRAAKLMPTIGHEVLRGVSFLVAGSRLTESDRAGLEALMAGMSVPVWIAEDQVRICADLASCGPALLGYVFAEMARAARRVRPDLSQELAERIVRETVGATAALLGEGGLTPDAIVDRVAVPGGNTAAALTVLRRHLPAAWEEAFRATQSNEAAMRASLGPEGR